MIGKANGAMSPTALGSLLQASTYGQTIPSIYGLMKSPLLAIWAQNLREGGSGKKYKNKKKGITTYVENIDFLLGHNPIMGVLQFWQNATKLPLNFVTQVNTIGNTGPHTIPITDPQFYAVVAVTVTCPYNGVTFDDFLAPSPVTVSSGTFELPLWNTAINGPDPTNQTAYLYWPTTYIWTPSIGPYVTLSNPCGGFYTPGTLSCQLGAPFNITIYYAQKSTGVSGRKSPAAYLNLTFEPTLADGPEYGATYAGQQVLMPPFAGVGSDNYDLGSSGAIADNRPEVQGSFGIYPSGDADFADMIVDIVKSGVAQVSPADSSTTLNMQPVQHGASCFSFPGAVQKKFISGPVTFLAPQNALTFDLPNVAGNILLVFYQGTGGSDVPTVSDTAGNSWNIVDNGNIGGTESWCVAWCVAVAAVAGNEVSFSPYNASAGVTMGICELTGVDSFDASEAFTLASDDETVESLTTTNTQGQAALAFAFTLDINVDITPPSRGPNQADPLWNEFFGLPSFQFNSAGSYVQSRTLLAPTTITINNKVTGQVDPGVTRIVLVSFKATVPSTTPQPFADIIDSVSLMTCRLQARAYGLWGSLSMQTQQACRDWLKDLYSSMNSAPFYSGNQLKQAPYGEVSAVGNGAIYTAPTAALAALSDLNGDFIVSDAKTDAPVSVERTAQFDAPSILQYQILNRASDYNPVVVSQPESGALALFGVRKEAPEVHDEITDTGIARILLGIKVRRQAYIRDSLKFTLGPRGILYEPMDIVTVTESLNALSNFPCRFTSLSIGANWQTQCEAEPYVYGVHSPIPVTSTSISPYQPDVMADPGSVTSYIIFEPPARITATGQPEIWIVASGDPTNENYAGAIVNVSTDGGSSYNPVGNLNGNPTSGVTVGDYPPDSPPTAPSLSVDLTQTEGVLESFTQTDEINATYLCYIAGGYTGLSLPPRWYSNTVYAVGQQIFDGVNTQQVTSVAGDATSGPPPNPPEWNPSMSGTTADNNVTWTNEGPPPAPYNEWPASTSVAVGYVIYDGINLQVVTTAGTTSGSLPYPWNAISGGTTTDGTVTWTNQGPPPQPNPGYSDYELVSYETATMTASYKYTLTTLHRSCFGQPPGAPNGVDHPSSSPFAFLGSPQQSDVPGISKIPMDPNWVGKQLIFKLTAVNIFGTAIQATSAAAPIGYVPTGVALLAVPQSSQYSISPASVIFSILQANITVNAFTATFPNGSANYVQRIFYPEGGGSLPDFPVPDEGVYVTYHISIYDPNYTGDVGPVILPTVISSGTQFVGRPGYIYCGAIAMVGTGSGLWATIAQTCGGWPPASSTMVSGF